MSVSPTLAVIGALVCAALGALVSWFVAAARAAAAVSRAETERERRAAAEAALHELRERHGELDRRFAAAEERVSAARQLVEEQKRFVEDSRKQLEDAFGALATNALRGSSAQFLELAEQRWNATREKAAGDLEARRKEIETLLAPLRETLQSLDAKTGEIEKARVGAYDSLKEHLTQLQTATGHLQEKATTLASALRGSQVRGRWGELALRNVAELAGMTEHCDFTEQSADAEGKRPDMVVKLPDGRFIAVDSKVPLTGYLQAVEASEESVRQAGLKDHVRAVRAHMGTLAGRDYADALEGDVDLVVLYLPGAPFLAAAFGEDPALQVEALRARVLLATPTTLVALLRTVAIYHQQRSLADNARVIADTARDLYERGAKFGEDLAAAGRGLKTAVDAYNRAVGSFERRFLPMGQKLESMKVTEQSRRELKSPEPLGSTVRDVGSAELGDA